MSANLQDLNYECLLRLFAYLQPADRMKLALSSDRFDDVTLYYIRQESINLADYLPTFTFLEFADILKLYGEFFKNVYIEFKELPSRLRDERLPQPAEFQCIEQLVIKPNDKLNIPLCYTLFALTQNLRKLHVASCRFTDRFCMLMGRMQNLTDINLSNNDLICCTGLETLVNLTHLNLSRCSSIEPQALHEILSASKLKSLNMRSVHDLDSQIFHTILKHQTELKRIELNAQFRTNNINWIVQIESLREIVIDFLHQSAERASFILELTKYRRNDLISLEIFHDIYWSRNQYMDLELVNLRKLSLNMFCLVQSDGAYIRDLVKRSARLEYFKLDTFPYWTHEVNEDHIFWVLNYLQELKTIDLTNVRMKRLDWFYTRLVDIVKGRATCPVIVNIYKMNFEEFKKNELYKKNESYVQLYTDYTRDISYWADSNY